ncbi:2,3-dihydroxybenzoate-AMP ligase VabE [Vibrio anguillarum]|uniref:2,3-dihydroxybenzoate-AMP ligase VabE n=1 Tax=Vibrio anguillarum TaxID=55601 RepID=UPI00097E3C67|nr:2,3-dihydroxybenzoate-AMP ligase VabE [Vibrio anguillarum]MBF4282572.1 (2,3-dihydroxybenzoyl)adenylate synthase [Vibrio anguillarum]MBF4286930.1 (2,3-dihydroxybenzoyl)adenylate synthase [Vibrio anguillarum]MBF4341411.1 (2,3-dihydroxybenzoyl)adenylate synthase [Vibrio anguillarum]MBF4356622.1 (2,3-dihydroxybenzoyl)adenylate synthase [Vibrio anguillarum]MBF4378192.1 (2,3-dihydroxybenzoyl)adenylate synthase [Vibrio anguillarum]
MVMNNLNPTDFTPWPEQFSQRYREQGYWQQRTLFDYFSDSVKKSPDAIALIDEFGQYSYQNLYQKMISLAAGLSSLGLQRGDNVVLQMANRAEFYLCFFALTMRGIKPVLALPAHRYLELSYFCQHTHAKAYIFSDDIVGFDAQQTAQKLRSSCPSLLHTIVCGQSSHEQIQELDTLYHCREDDPITDSVFADQVAFFQLSGGTTGTPKLIPRTHNDYAYSVLGSIQICQFGPQTRYLCVLPVAHNFPLSSPGALGVFYAGGCVVLASDTTPHTAFRLIEKHHITVAALVPPLALLWMKYAESATENIASLTLVQVGGAKFSEAAAMRLPTTLHCQLQQVFGMAEGLVNYTRLDDPLSVIVTTQGRPISADDEVMIINDEGEPAAVGEEGLLMTRGPYTIRGYYRAPEHNQRSFTDQGFYITGDRVRRTAEGNIIVTGREKDQINRGGEKIAAEEVENLLLQHQDVHDVALVAIADEFLGERSCAIVVPDNGKTLKPITLKRFLHAQGLAEFKIPDHIHFVDELPKTPVGKVDKKWLRTQYSH